MHAVKAVLILGILGCCLGEIALATTTPGGNPVVGHISWTIYDGASKKALGHGKKDVRLNDIKIDASMPQGMKKEIALSDHFTFAYVEMPEASKSSLVGFGVNAGKDDNSTFSWEWLNVDKPGHATKIQETGQIAFKQVKTANGWEISKMDFTTDLSCRVIILMKDRDPRKPRWRVNILKGSSITWPSIVNGKLVAN